MSEAEKREELCRQFINLFGSEPKVMRRLSGAGGNRVYYHMRGAFLPSADVECIGVAGTDVIENNAFISLSEYFKTNGINVPPVYGVGESGYTYLCKYLGDVDLLSVLHSKEGEVMLEETIKSLAKLQTLPVTEWQDKTMCPSFNLRQVMWDLNYFKYEYLKPSGVDFNEDLLEDDFEKFAAGLLDIPANWMGFMYRDCQSRNVMICDNQPYWIDFQAGRVGPCVYDIVSLLWQSKAHFSDEERARWLALYISEFRKYRKVDNGGEFYSLIDKFAIFRTLQVLGAYGFRGLVEKRAHFIESIPGALENLKVFLDAGKLREFAELERVCKKIVSDRRFFESSAAGLTIEVFSFSYKKGYPADYSGNGGGFMFDCRWMHNPGRYAEYKNLTGRDRSVIEFLEEKGEVFEFMNSVQSIITPAVKRYLQRGFKKLQIGFGCTGGQHRSVYSAQHMAEWLRRNYPECRVILNHREQGINEEITA